jgi:uncharacterized protein YggL (DUF469 family)
MNSSSTQALFENLVFNEQDQPAEVVRVGDEFFYVILDGDFRRHVEAEAVDRQVLEWLSQQIEANKDLVSEGAMSMMGQDDLFTKATIESSLENVEEQMEQLLQQGLPDGARTWLGMMGFRVVVNVHGEVVGLDAPSGEEAEDW